MLGLNEQGDMVQTLSEYFDDIDEAIMSAVCTMNTILETYTFTHKDGASYLISKDNEAKSTCVDWCKQGTYKFAFEVTQIDDITDSSFNCAAHVFLGDDGLVWYTEY